MTDTNKTEKKHFCSVKITNGAEFANRIRSAKLTKTSTLMKNTRKSPHFNAGMDRVML